MFSVHVHLCADGGNMLMLCYAFCLRKRTSFHLFMVGVTYLNNGFRK